MATTMSLEELAVWYDQECKRIRESNFSAHEKGMAYAHVDDEYDKMYDKIMGEVFSLTA